MAATVESLGWEGDEWVVIGTVLRVHVPLPWHSCDLVSALGFSVVDFAGLVVVKVIDTDRVVKAAREAM
jgi:hypothetical protein